MATATAEKTSAAAASTDKPINQETTNLAVLIKAAVKPAAAVVGPKELYGQLINQIDEELTLDLVERLRKADEKIAAAAGLAWGEVSIPLMKKDPELQRTTFSLPMTGRDSLEVVFDRSRTVPDRSEGNTGGTRQQFGSLNVGMDLYGTRNRGQLSAVKAKLKADAAKALG